MPFPCRVTTRPSAAAVRSRFLIRTGVKRIVFSNDGLVYYTEDHYESFELLYGDEHDG